MRLRRLYVGVCAMVATTVLSAGPVSAWGVADEVLIGEAPAEDTVAATEEVAAAAPAEGDVAAGTVTTDTTAEVPAAEPKIRRDIEDGMYILVPKLSPSLGMGINDNSTDAGANVELVGDSGIPGKVFQVERLGNTSRYTFVNQNSGMSIEWDTTRSDVDETAAPASFVTQNAYTGDLNQQWVIEELSNGYFQIRACGEKMVLDLANGLFDEGTDIRVYQANQTDAQMWMLVKVEEEAE